MKHSVMLYVAITYYGCIYSFQPHEPSKQKPLISLTFSNETQADIAEASIILNLLNDRKPVCSAQIVLKYAEKYFTKNTVHLYEPSMLRALQDFDKLKYAYKISCDNFSEELLHTQEFIIDACSFCVYHPTYMQSYSVTVQCTMTHFKHARLKLAQEQSGFEIEIEETKKAS